MKKKAHIILYFDNYIRSDTTNLESKKE
uniref:Uncharacterized protein n=1 Tax=Rhizophora mucronata TaxID=61149 RepID=A0A2P2N8W7_RHIMU